MRCHENRRFVNEQTYLNTVCKSRCPPKRKMRPKDDCYLECCCDTCFGKLTVRTDKHNTGICLDICHNEPQCGCERERKDCCDRKHFFNQ